MSELIEDPALLVPDWADKIAAAHRFESKHEWIPGFALPEGKKVAVNFTADFDAMLFRKVLKEPEMQVAKGEFGGRVGIWRLLELFKSQSVPITLFTPGRICELYPDALEVAVADGHELAEHMWEHQTPQTTELQADHLRRSTEALARIRGRPVVGTRSYYQQRLLKQAGYLYNSVYGPSLFPYYAKDDSDDRCLLQLPLHLALDDAQFFNFSWLSSPASAQRITDPERVSELWWDAFIQAYENGGYLNFCLHPFISGRALRIEMLDALIARMKAMPGVWFSTCETFANYCVERFPPRRLRP